MLIGLMRSHHPHSHCTAPLTFGVQLFTYRLGVSITRFCFTVYGSNCGRLTDREEWTNWVMRLSATELSLSANSGPPGNASLSGHSGALGYLRWCCSIKDSITLAAGKGATWRRQCGPGRRSIRTSGRRRAISSSEREDTSQSLRACK